MAIMRQMQHHTNQLTGIKGALNTVETGLKIYGTLKGVYQVGQSVYKAAQVAGPIIAGLL